ncbi:SusE domain-containing protein [uncultured Porphyromonas sp.]|uniref:SusE domain-containing protein n=1 Tax=uncultured Porphyromonas sp. TaxID=159274 RepID=UPI0025ECD7D5|nr:SusE domain-containing protein [uncultured Porphyromonas sp.]
MNRIHHLASATLAALILSLVAGCSTEDPMESFDAVLSSKSPAVLDQPASTAMTITPESTGTLDLSWSAAKYGDKIPVTYTLVISRGGSEKRIEFPVLTGARQISIPLQQLNKRLVTELEMEGDTQGKVSVMVEALPLADKGNDHALETYKTTSAPLELTITPFLATVRPDLYFLVGDLSGRDGAPGWNEKNNDHIFFADDNSALTYHYYGYLKAGAAFKIFPEASIGSWDNVLGIQDGKLDTGGGNIELPADSPAGYYQITLTVNRGKLDPAKAILSFTPIDVSTKPTFDKIGIIGTAGIDWDHDLLLEQSKTEPHLWIGRGIELKEGEFKLRADAAWNTNWGGQEKEKFPTDFGIAEGGENWKVTAKEAGTYDVYFNDLTGNYFINKLDK